jgi:hypothetical protein
MGTDAYRCFGSFRSVVSGYMQTKTQIVPNDPNHSGNLQMVTDASKYSRYVPTLQRTHDITSSCLWKSVSVSL